MVVGSDHDPVGIKREGSGPDGSPIHVLVMDVGDSRSPPLCHSIDVFFYPGLGIDKGMSRDCSVSPIALRYMN